MSILYPRRQVLTQLCTLAAGATLSHVHPHQNKGESTDQQTSKEATAPQFSFLHLTDLHIMPENRAVEGVRQALESITSLPEKPAFALIGGDIVHAASHADRKRAELLYDLWQETSALLKLPMYYTVGNGDCLGTAGGNRLAAADPEYGKRWWQKRLNLSQRFLTFDHGGWRFIVLDSVQTGGDVPYYGEIDKEQMEWLDNLLRKTEMAQPIVVLTHIPLLTAFGLYDEDPSLAPAETMIVRNGKAVMELFQGRAVRAVFQGHTHAVEECLYAGTRYICGGAVCGNWWQGRRFGIHPEGFGVITINGSHLDYRYHAYGWNVPQSLVQIGSKNAGTLPAGYPDDCGSTRGSAENPKAEYRLSAAVRPEEVFR